jgi:hypothetical protein
VIAPVAAPVAVEIAPEPIAEPAPVAAEEPFADSVIARSAAVDSRILSDAPVAAPVEARAPEPAPEPEIAFSETEKPAARAEVKHVKVRSSVDIMAELESLRKKATSTTPKPVKKESAADVVIPTPRAPREIHRNLSLQTAPGVLPRAKTVRVTVSFEDGESAVLQTQEQLVELGDTTDVRSLALNLKIDPA